MKKPAIILHVDELMPIGVEVEPIASLHNINRGIHRDDHYMFVLQTGGHFVWEVDFKEITLTGPSVCYIAPGQVHRYIDFKQAEGWLVFVATGLIPNQSREVFDACLNAQQMVAVKAGEPVFKIVPMLDDILQQEALPLRNSLVGSLVETLAGLVAANMIQSQNAINLIGGQKYKTANCFKQLVREKYRELKQVQAYAALLNITPLYLNEIAKEVTGFSASYWINQEILLEAKRMLCYTTLDVKQVAYELGYDDHAYFSRFFKKHAGVTAVEFRNQKPLFVLSSP